MTTFSYKLHLAVVDDDPSILESMRQVFIAQQSFGPVDLYSSPVEALRKIPNNPPDLVIMDIWMPRLDGIVTTRLLKKTRPDLLVIMYTACAGPGEVRKALATGANGYLIKPAPVMQMLHAIETVLAGEIYLPQSTWEIVLPSLQGPSELLGNREREVLQLKQQGLSYKLIAERLGISERTVNSHLAHIRRKESDSEMPSE